MTHGSLFSGIGGFDLAAQWMGWENIFHCEWNPFGQKVLKHHFPNSISYDDITKTDFTIHRGSIDVLTGGFPCQPYSLAGKRKGKEDERHLWPEMLRAIREIQPRFVVGENVLGLVNWSNGLVFHEVQTDLETAGYEVWPYVLPACAVNAPHRRDRVWFIAYLREQRCNNGIDNREERHIQTTGEWELSENKSERDGRKLGISEDGSVGTWNDTDTYRNGRNGRNGEYEVNTSERRINALGDIEQMGKYATNPNGSSKGSPEKSAGVESNGGYNDAKQKRGRIEAEQYNGCGSILPSSSNTNGIEGRENEWGYNGESNEFDEDGKTRSFLHSNGTSKPGKHIRQTREGKFNGSDSRDGINHWQNFPTQSPICGGDDGLSDLSHINTIQKENTMDRTLVIKSAIEAGRLIADIKTGKIYSTVTKLNKGVNIELTGADCNGYRVHNISFGGIKKQCRAHQIVWIYANGIYDKNNLMIDHIDRNRSNNKLSNLRLVDAKGNMENKTPYDGKLTQEQKDEMYLLYTQGDHSMRELAEDFGISKSRVQQLISEHGGMDGITFSKWRNESIKAFGNAIVPQVAYQIFKAIEQL
jgi:DNA (cytosine-5)-methyltransferase 1